MEFVAVKKPRVVTTGENSQSFYVVNALYVSLL